MLSCAFVAGIFAWSKIASAQSYNWMDVSPSKISWSTVEAAVRKPHVKTVADLLAELPKDQLENQIFIHNSASMQGATFQHPRVLIFNEDASFIFTFNGDPSLRGYGSIETVEFNKNTKSFEFRQLFFNAEGKSPLPPSDVLEDNDRFQISKVNPKTCVGCHGGAVSPRPNWAKYFVWPGVYGGYDDNQMSLLIGKKAPDVRRPLFLSSTAPDYESQGLKRFLNEWPKNSRYQKLNMPPIFESYVNGRAEKEFGQIPFRIVNTTFSSILQELNHERIARLLAKSDLARSNKYLVLGLAHCPLDQYDFKYPRSSGPQLSGTSLRDSKAYRDAYNELYKIRYEFEFSVRDEFVLRNGYKPEQISAKCIGCAKNLEKRDASSEARGESEMGDENEFLAVMKVLLKDPNAAFEKWSMNPIRPNHTFGSGLISNLNNGLSRHLRAELLDPAVDRDLLEIVNKDSELASNRPVATMTPYSVPFCSALLEKASRQ